jgi:hypothetical protein
VDDAVARALAKNPLERYHSAADFVDALEGREPRAAVTRPGMPAAPVPLTRELEAAQAAALSLSGGTGQTTAPLNAPETPHAWSVARNATPAAQPVASPPRRALFATVGVLVVVLTMMAGGGIVFLATRGDGGDDMVTVSQPAPSELATIPEQLAAPDVEAAAPDAATLSVDAAPSPSVEEQAVAELPPAPGMHRSGRRAQPVERPAGVPPAEAVPAAAAPAVAPAVAPTAAQIPEATRAQYRAQIAQYETQNREIDALLSRIAGLRPTVRGMGNAERPALCNGSGVRAMSQPSEVPIVVSQQQRIRREIERTCEPFDRLENTPPEIRRDLDSIASTLDRAEEMTRSNVSSNQPTEIAEQVRDAIGEARRTLAGVQEGRRPFPCNAPVFRRLRTLKDAGNTYSGAAAGRVDTLRGRICGRLGTDVDDLRSAERRFTQTLDDTEGTLRSTQRSFRQVIDQLRPWTQ